MAAILSIILFRVSIALISSACAGVIPLTLYIKLVVFPAFKRVGAFPISDFIENPTLRI